MTAGFLIARDYGEGKDVVTPVLSVRPAAFQEVIPRYNLSATETRDQGVGPVFEEVAYHPPAYSKVQAHVKNRSVKIDERLKPRKRNQIKVDFFT